MGPKRLPGIGKGLGQGMREFKEGITGESSADEEKPTLNEASQMPQSPPADERAGSERAGSSSGSGSERASSGPGSEHSA
ncbi:MAG: Sec-independent protein translocase subunit TatA/TatB [Solirubrobacteraceae bacterium]